MNRSSIKLLLKTYLKLDLSLRHKLLKHWCGTQYAGHGNSLGIISTCARPLHNSASRPHAQKDDLSVLLTPQEVSSNIRTYIFFSMRINGEIHIVILM